MKVTIIYDGFSCPFADLVDRERFDVYEVQGLIGGWVVVKKEEDEEKE